MIDELCDRIDELDHEIQAFLPEPDRRERLEAAGTERPSFLVAVKDIFRVDGFETRAGSVLPPEELAGEQAACVTRLLEAGALVLGKTNTTEFAMMDPGPTRNPRNPAHTPGGSSSGSAAAVAAGMAPLAIGSQTTGSVIRPAAYCGVVGFKPSFDRIPTAGMLYCARSVDTVGLFTADVAAMASAATVLLDDWREVELPGRPKLAVPDGPYLDRLAPDDRRDFEELGEILGARRVPALEDFEALAERHSRLVAYEFAREHADLFERYGELYRPCARGLVESGRDVSDDEAEELRPSRFELRARLEAAMDEHGFDLWVSPPAPGPAPAGLDSTGDPSMNLPWTHAGLPTLALPAGVAANGLPLGLQLSARFGCDEELLAWSRALEGTFAMK